MASCSINVWNNQTDPEVIRQTGKGQFLFFLKKEVEAPQCHWQLGQMLRPANIWEQEQGR